MNRPINDNNRKRVFRAAELFFKGIRNAAGIAEDLNNEFPGTMATRQTVYKLVQEARTLQMLRLLPPPESNLEREIKAKYHIEEHQVNPVTVVWHTRDDENSLVSEIASDIALSLLHLAKREPDESVGLGLGPGPSTLEFSRALSSGLLQDKDSPKLNLVAISAGSASNRPHEAPVGFFNLFPQQKIAAQYGLFAQPVARVKEMAKLRSLPGVKDTFERRECVSLVVSSMGEMKHEHNHYRALMHECYPKPASRPNWLKNVIGDVQFRPFSKEGPILEDPNDYRPITLFELEDLSRMANEKGRFVLLIAKRCSICKKTRAKALAPLLRWPNKRRPFTHLVLDYATSLELLTHESNP